MADGEYGARVAHHRKTYRTSELQPGFSGDRIDFDFRPYSKRSPEARKDYDRLKADLLSRGMLDPLITHKGHVLIGMRRFEILKDRQDTFECIEIDEDVSLWWRDDLPKLEWLKQTYYAS